MLISLAIPFEEKTTDLLTTLPIPT